MFSVPRPRSQIVLSLLRQSVFLLAVARFVRDRHFNENPLCEPFPSHGSFGSFGPLVTPFTLQSSLAIHRFMWKNKEGLMVIRAFVHLIKVGRQPFAADEGGKRPGNPCCIVSIGMPTYAAA